MFIVLQDIREVQEEEKEQEALTNMERENKI